MKFPCRLYKECENFKENACDGCGELKKYPEWFIEAGSRIVDMIVCGELRK